MTIKINKLLYIIVEFIIISEVSIFAASQIDSPLRKEFNEDVNSVLRLIQANDKEEAIKLADELDKKWFQKDKQNYSMIINTIAEAFNNYELADKYTKKALEKLYNLPENERIPIEEEYYLEIEINKNIVDFIHENIQNEKGWLENRRESAKYYFTFLERIEKNIDPNWDPVSNPNLPPGSPQGYTGAFISGMSPDGITDPKFRSQYQAALDKFWENSLFDKKQSLLRRLKEKSLISIHRKIISLYSGPEFLSKNLETESLRKDISKYVNNEKIVFKILDDLKNRLTEDMKPKPQVHSMTTSGRGYRNPLTNEIIEKRLPPPDFDKEHSSIIIDDGQYKKIDINQNQDVNTVVASTPVPPLSPSKKLIGIALPLAAGAVVGIFITGVIMFIRKKKLNKTD